MAGEYLREVRAVIGLMGLLSACAETPHVEPDVDATGMPNAELALGRSMERVDAAMLQLGAIGPGGGRTAAGIPAELQRPQSFTWSGPIDEGAKALADRIGYRLVVTAPSNPMPVVVSVKVPQAPALDLLKALGNAAGTQATVLVDPDHRQVEVDHHV